MEVSFFSWVSSWFGWLFADNNNLPQTGDTFFFLHKDRDITAAKTARILVTDTQARSIIMSYAACVHIGRRPLAVDHGKP